MFFGSVTRFGKVPMMKGLLSLSFFLTIAANANAESFLDVVKVEGHAYRTAENSKEAVELHNNDILNEGDRIEVGDASRLLIGDPASQFWLGSNSSVTVRTGQIVENTAIKRKVLSLLKGNLRVHIKTGEGAKFEVRTKAAVAGVRGTEFFFANENENVTFCVLTGQAWLKDEKSGKQFEVPEGAGIVLSADGAVKKTFTSEQTKFDWIAMTAFDGERRLTGSFYSQDPEPLMINDQWSYSYAFTGVARTYINRDYNFQLSDPSDNMYHAFLTPTIIYKSPISVQLTPRIFTYQSDRAVQWDDVPATTEDARSGVYMQEAFADYKTDSWSMRAGLFALDWKENALFMARPWMQESLSHLGLNLGYKIALDNTNLLLEAVYTTPSDVKNMEANSGRTNIGVKALRLTEAKNRFTVNLLERENGEFVNSKSMYYRTGNKIQQAIIDVRDTLQYFDYDTSVGYQNIEAFKGSKNPKETTEYGLSVDAAIGIPLPGEYRVQARYIHADPNYVPGVEDYYEMGFIGRFAHTNIRQSRLLVEKSFGDIHRIRAEFMNSIAAGNSIFKTSQTTNLPPVGGKLLANETDLVWLANWTKSVQTFAALWYLGISDYLGATKADPAWGANIGFRITQ